ncbi:MAG: glutamate---cysteine ligase / carboxylate-amine ligase [Solirubrobacterales bacterium]|nr:glutamate---cysteine ligase / carboxylate-amine ligase [Solirubrobacterales bacterium]
MSAEPEQSSAPESTGAPDLAEHRFGASPPLSIGVEEELLLVDERRELVAESEAVLDAVDAPFADRVSAEIFAEQIELKTGICDGFDDVLAELAETRRAIREAGFGLLACGLHPSSQSGEAKLVGKPRYEVVRRDFGDLLRTPPCGLHIHVGMPDPETAVRIANAFCLYLPLLQALSANSPFREGVDSGNASSRTSVVRSYPRFQLPRQFHDYAEFREVADQLIAAAGVDDYTYVWWDVRPHPRLGTVEVRAVDVQTDALTSSALAALVQAIAAKELDRPTAPGLYREALEESYFQATSHGLDARILLDEEAPEPAREAGRRVLESVGPYARELGGEPAIEEIERILRDGNGADDQRRVHRAGGMAGLLDHLAEPAL